MSAAMLPLPFRPGRLGPDHAIIASFEQFYRERLRFVSGGRVQASQLVELYGRWAAARSAPSIGSRGMRQHMEQAGHRYFRSDGTWYADVEVSPCDVQRSQVILNRIDAMLAEVRALRAEVAAA